MCDTFLCKRKSYTYCVVPALMPVISITFKDETKRYVFWHRRTQHRGRCDKCLFKDSKDNYPQLIYTYSNSITSTLYPITAAGQIFFVRLWRRIPEKEFYYRKPLIIVTFLNLFCNENFFSFLNYKYIHLLSII